MKIQEAILLDMQVLFYTLHVRKRKVAQSRRYFKDSFVTQWQYALVKMWQGEKKTVIKYSVNRQFVQ